MLVQSLTIQILMLPTRHEVVMCTAVLDFPKQSVLSTLIQSTDEACLTIVQRYIINT